MEAFVPLARPLVDGNELKYLTECITGGYVTHAGRFEKAFESAFGERFGTQCLATSSGTGALHLSLLALGIGPGDEVIVPALTFGATAAAVLAVGAKPVLVDVDEGTLGLDKDRLKKVLNRRVRAIIPVHLYGEDAGDFREFGVPVVEDACESLGFVPIRGDYTCYSFYGNKTMTTGEGGMVCGDVEKVRPWRDGGFDSQYRNVVPGLNYRMTNMQAAVGLAQLERFDDFLDSRIANAQAYGQLLEGRGKWLFVADVADPVGLQAHLKSHRIETRPVFTPLHLSPAFRDYGRGRYKVAERIWERGLCLPTGPHVSEDTCKRIAGLVLDYGTKTIREPNGTGHLQRPDRRDCERASP